ncbi:MAG: UDP-2,3-diacylglucosamine diphosphatase [Bacteroidetes bacterium]|nr:UDP-2,3-diacylglucosamine diphosphatase [Bacteroidota bacterium]
MKNIFFFSDVHFGLQTREQEKEKERRVLAFLSYVEEHGEELFILGDLFDYWFEYKSVVPRGYHHILSKLGSMVEHGIKIHYAAGNHDFWLRDFFPTELGIPVYKEPFAMTLRGKKFFFHHGDGLALHDTGYRILKKILRSKINIFLYSLLHPDWTAPIAKGSSKTSREYTGTKDYGETDGMKLFAEKKINEGFEVVMMGHRHHPAYEKIGSGIYVNLGDWISFHTYAEFDGTTVVLKSWE